MFGEAGYVRGDWARSGGVSQSLAWASELDMYFIFMERSLPLIPMVEMHLGFK